MLLNKEKLKSFGSFILAIGFLFLTTLMFFPWHDWSTGEPNSAVVERLVIKSRKYGTTPYYIVRLENGKSVSIKAPIKSSYKPEDEVQILTFTCAKHKNHKRYALSLN